MIDFERIVLEKIYKPVVHFDTIRNGKYEKPMN